MPTTDPDTTMLTPDEFTLALQNLGAAFGKPLNGPLVLQYYKVFKVLSSKHLDALITWAIETQDTPFPTIARLRKHAMEEGWFPKPERRPDSDLEQVIVSCPKCDGSFAIRKDRLMADAKGGVVYMCGNPEHRGCPVTFSAASLLQEMRLS